MESLPTQFTTKDPRFVHLASTRRLVYHTGFEEVRLTYSAVPGGAVGSSASAASAVAAGASMGLVIPGMPTTILQTAALAPAGSRGAKNEQSKRKRKASPSAAGSDGAGSHKKHRGEDLPHSAARGSSTDGNEEGGDEEEEEEEEEDLHEALRRLQGGEREDDEDGSDGYADGAMSTSELASKLRGYMKLCRRRSKELERSQGVIQGLRDQLSAMKAELQSVKERGSRFRSHLFRIVGDLGQPSAGRMSVRAFCDGNIVYTTYAEKVQQTQQGGSKVELLPHSSACAGGHRPHPSSMQNQVRHCHHPSPSVGGLYASRPKGIASSSSQQQQQHGQHPSGPSLSVVKAM